MRIPKGNDENRSWNPLPVADYCILITKVDTTRTSRGSDPKPQVMIQGEVVSDEYNGKKVTEFFFATPKALWRLENLFKALGIPGDETGDIDAEGKAILDYPEDELIERIVTVRILQDKYTDKTTGEVKTSNDWDAGTYAISPQDPYYDEVIAELKAAAASSGSAEQSGEPADEPVEETVADAPQAPARPAPGARRRRRSS